MGKYAKMSQEDFNEYLAKILQDHTDEELVSMVPGIHELVSEHFNSQVLDLWLKDNPDKIIFEYFINLDERGEFQADVRDPDGKTVYTITGEPCDGFSSDVFSHGFMRHKYDLDGLKALLVGLDIMEPENTLVKGN